MAGTLNPPCAWPVLRTESKAIESFRTGKVWGQVASGNRAARSGKAAPTVGRAAALPFAWRWLQSKHSAGPGPGPGPSSLRVPVRRSGSMASRRGAGAPIRQHSPARQAQHGPGLSRSRRHPVRRIGLLPGLAGRGAVHPLASKWARATNVRAQAVAVAREARRDLVSGTARTVGPIRHAHNGHALRLASVVQPSHTRPNGLRHSGFFCAWLGRGKAARAGAGAQGRGRGRGRGARAGAMLRHGAPSVRAVPYVRKLSPLPHQHRARRADAFRVGAAGSLLVSKQCASEARGAGVPTVGMPVALAHARMCSLRCPFRVGAAGSVLMKAASGICPGRQS
jgi:hypothetical protein